MNPKLIVSEGRRAFSFALEKLVHLPRDEGKVLTQSVRHGFWILVALVATFTVIAGRWAFRKRGDY